MAIRPYAGGGSQAFQGDNQPLYVQNQNELKKAFNQVQASSISGAAPIGSVIMWAGTTANAPSTYAVCNGASLSTTGTYAALFAVIGYRYGGSGANFNLPDFTSNVPVGITGVPVVPSTKTTSIASSPVDAHTHTVNGTINASGAPNVGLGMSVSDINTPSVAANRQVSTALGMSVNNVEGPNLYPFFPVVTGISIVLNGDNSNIGNTQAHSHGVIGNTGSQSANHAHTNSGQSANHTHSYFRPNTGANNNTGTPSVDHTHTVNQNTTNHSHGILFNSQNANATGINGQNSNIGINTGNVSTHTHAGASLVSGNADSHTHIGGILTQGNANTHTHGAANLTAATATTINASTPAHTHTTATTQIIFIIRVS